MDGGLLDVDFRCNFGNVFGEKENESLLSLIENDFVGFTSADPYTEDLFTETIDDDDFVCAYGESLLMMQMSSGSSVGSSQTSICSLSPSTDILMEDYQKVYSDWQEHLVALNSSDEEFDMENAVAADIKNLVNESSFSNNNNSDENGRKRNYSASSYTGPCIPPDLIISNQADGFLIDVLPDIEDVQEQIFLDDGHHLPPPEDMLIPLDEPVDGRKLQEQLINQLTGNSQSFLVNESSEAGIGCMVGETPVESSNKVKNVEASPGSKNVFIDGMDVQLPAGSIVLAVVNESGSLVPLPPSTQSLTSSIGDVLSSSSSSFPSCTVPTPSKLFDSFVVEENGIFNHKPNSLNDCLFTPSSTCFDALKSIKHEGNNNSVSDVEMKQQDSLVFEMDSENTPIIEAVDLATLLAEFEANECRNNGLQADFLYPMNCITSKQVDTELSFLKTEKEAETGMPNKLLMSPHYNNMQVMKNLEEQKDVPTKIGAEYVDIKQETSYEFIEIINEIPVKENGQMEAVMPNAEDIIPVIESKLQQKESFNNGQQQQQQQLLNVVKEECFEEDTSPAPRSPSEWEVPATAVTFDHDYCKSPCSKKDQIKDNGEKEKIYNKLPDYCQSLLSEPNEMVSDMQSADKNIGKTSVDAMSSVYNKLPDYVTDIGNAKPSEEILGQNDQDSQSSSSMNKDKSQPKKKLKLSEYRMRIRSSEESRSSSPSVLEESSTNMQKLPKSSIVQNSQFANSNAEQSDDQNKTTNTSSCSSPTSTINDVPVATSATNGNASNIPTIAKVPIKVKTVSAPKSSKRSTVSNHSNRSKLHNNHRSKATKNKPPVIEIDLEDGELEGESEAVKSENAQSKLPLISTLSLAKMPTTSLGHSLLFSRKSRAMTSQEKTCRQKSRNASSSCVSTSSRDSISPYSTDRKKKYKYDSDHSSRYTCSYSSRSRSRPRSSKSASHRSKSSGSSSRVRNHRKSRRRWSRSRSRSRGKSKSRSYSSSSISSTSSYYSRSLSRTHSKSYTSRSRSRTRSKSRSSTRTRTRSRSKSRSSWRRDRRSRHYSRNSDKYRRTRNSCSRSPRGRSWRGRNSSPRNSYRSRSPYSSSRYSQSHASSRHIMSRHRSIEEIEKDVQERRVIYIGCLDEGTTRADIRRRFEKFGQIIDINIHFRERGDNYGFVTFKYREHAYEALEHGNDDPSLPRYNLCFGGRRSFCKAQYSDLDAQKDEYEYSRSSAVMDYDSLLKAALKMRR